MTYQHRNFGTYPRKNDVNKPFILSYPRYPHSYPHSVCNITVDKKPHTYAIFYGLHFNITLLLQMLHKNEDKKWISDDNLPQITVLRRFLMFITHLQLSTPCV